MDLIFSLNFKDHKYFSLKNIKFVLLWIMNIYFISYQLFLFMYSSTSELNDAFTPSPVLAEVSKNNILFCLVLKCVFI